MSFNKENGYIISGDVTQVPKFLESKGLICITDSFIENHSDDITAYVVQLDMNEYWGIRDSDIEFVENLIKISNDSTDNITFSMKEFKKKLKL